MTPQEIIDRLMEYHQEADPGPISDVALEAAWAKGYADPCGCALCQLMQDLTAEQMDQGQGGAQ